MRTNYLLISLTVFVFSCGQKNGNQKVESDSTAVSIQPEVAISQSNTVRLITYPAGATKKGDVLVDKVKGTEAIIEQWLGFEGDNMEIIIDLQSETVISKISIGFLQNVDKAIFFPSEIAFHGSTNGQAYRPIGTVYNQQPLSSKGNQDGIQYFLLTNLETRLRYLLIAGKNISTAPDWHANAGEPAWIYADEVELN